MSMNKKSIAAIITVFALALLLCSPASFSAMTARAEAFDDEITAYAELEDAEFDGGQTGDGSAWAVFYRGTKLLETARWKYVGGGSYDETEGEITISASSDGDPNAVHIAVNNASGDKRVLKNSALNVVDNHGYGGTHDFTSGTAAEKIDDGTHYAVCECGLMLQVAHRPSDSGGCEDCDIEFNNTYTFSSEAFGGEIEWDPETSEASITISVDAEIYCGYVLKLNLQSENGGALTTGGASDGVPYEVEVNPDVGEALSTDGDLTGGIAIWQFTAADNADDDGILAKIDGGTITVILKLTDDFPYSGDYFDTLTFSVTCEVEGAS